MRFNRNYNVVIGEGDTALIIDSRRQRYPLKVSFSCQKSILGGLNKLNLVIYNLKESNRLRFLKRTEQQTKYIGIELAVGYGDDVKVIFKGSVLRGSNNKEGTDFTTTFEAIEGGFDLGNDFISGVAFSKEEAINNTINSFQNVTKGKITKFNDLTRPKILFGSPSKIIGDVLEPNTNAYIDKDQLFITKNDEVTSGFIPVVKNETGLLNTPQLEFNKISFETLLNSAVTIGNRVKLVSEVNPAFSGIYKVTTIRYDGANYGDDWKQAITGFSVEGIKQI